MSKQTKTVVDEGKQKLTWPLFFRFITKVVTTIIIVNGVLKVHGLIQTPWWLILSPLWIGFGVLVIALGVASFAMTRLLEEIDKDS